MGLSCSPGIYEGINTVGGPKKGGRARGGLLFQTEDSSGTRTKYVCSDYQ